MNESAASLDIIVLDLHGGPLNGTQLAAVERSDVSYINLLDDETGQTPKRSKLSPSKFFGGLINLVSPARVPTAIAVVPVLHYTDPLQLMCVALNGLPYSPFGIPPSQSLLRHMVTGMLWLGSTPGQLLGGIVHFVTGCIEAAPWPKRPRGDGVAPNAQNHPHMTVVSPRPRN